MPPIDATPFINIVPRGHRPRFARELRQALGNAMVTPATRELCAEWQQRLGCSRGILLDQVFAFALMRGFVRVPSTKNKKHHGH